MAVDMFLKIENVKGESTDEAHKDWIEVESFSWGLSQLGSNSGRGGGGGAGKVSMQDISIVRSVDKATPKLMEACCNGKHLSEATLSVRKSGGNQDYLKYKLTDILISGYQMGGSSGDIPLEEVSLNFHKVQVDYLNERTKETETAVCGDKAGKNR